MEQSGHLKLFLRESHVKHFVFQKYLQHFFVVRIKENKLVLDSNLANFETFSGHIKESFFPEIL